MALHDGAQLPLGLVQIALHGGATGGAGGKLGIVRIECGGAPEGGMRIGEALLGQIRLCEIGVKRGVSALDSDGPLDQGNCFTGSAGLKRNQAQQMECVRMPGL